IELHSTSAQGGGGSAHAPPRAEYSTITSDTAARTPTIIRRRTSGRLDRGMTHSPCFGGKFGAGPAEEDAASPVAPPSLVGNDLAPTLGAPRHGGQGSASIFL